ncbi:MAG: hypothetical protein J1F10_00175 [Muribaculaceae bacterium]|nr:hypothetical protein [Muribaculaceae bacterium]
MKKFFTIIVAACMLMPVCAGNVQKSLDKALAKAQKKEMSQKMKEYKKGGYEILGSRTMEVALLKHYSKLNELGDNGLVFEGYAANTKSKNTAEQMALNNATIKYAQKAGSTIKGRVVSDIFADGTDSEGEFEKFYAAYERIVEQKVKNVLVPSYSVIKQKPDGTYEIQSFFIVDETKARNARKAALESALTESELAQKYAASVRGFVEETVAE